jgi:lipopolysaccharide transport system permease protein
MKYFREVFAARLVLSALALRDIRGHYRLTFLGQLWSLANPLTQMLVYTFVFSFVFQVKSAPGSPSGVDSFALYLLCGLIPWSLFQNVVSSSMASPLLNASLISKVYFPRLIIPLSSVVATSYNSALELLVLVVALVVAGSFVWPWIPLAVLILALLICFGAGLGLLLSVANLHFRDTQYLLGVVFPVWMWMSPIIYPISLVVDRSNTLGPLAHTPITLLGIYELNPIVHFIAAFRNVLYDNRLPTLTDMGMCGLWALGSMIVGISVFRRHENRLAELL